jgi:hypothetical protein
MPVKPLINHLVASQSTRFSAKMGAAIQVTESHHVTKITNRDDLDRICSGALKTYFRGLNFSRVINREHTTDRRSLSSAVGFLLTETLCDKDHIKR